MTLTTFLHAFCLGCGAGAGYVITSWLLGRIFR